MNSTPVATSVQSGAAASTTALLGTATPANVMSSLVSCQRDANRAHMTARARKHRC